MPNVSSQPVVQATMVPPDRVAGATEGKTWTVPEVGMEFVWIAALKGWVGKYEVTNGEYRRFKTDHSSQDFKGHSLNGGRQPVVQVTFDDANAYAAWLTEHERAAGRLRDGMQYRLPTKDEWTALAQCGDSREYPWGNGWPPQYGNYAGGEAKEPLGFSVIDGYNDGSVVSCPVEKSGKNDWGVYGVGGNVWECTSASPGGGFDAWRGASWGGDDRAGLRCGSRGGGGAADGYFDGFRLVLSR